MKKLDDLTIAEAREIASLFGNSCKQSCSPSHPYEVEENYFIRTVTHHFVGRLVDVHQGELVVDHCSWIADDGRFMDAVAKGSFNEVEPFPPESLVIINRASIIDVVKVAYKMPTSQK